MIGQYAWKECQGMHVMQGSLIAAAVEPIEGAWRGHLGGLNVRPTVAAYATLDDGKTALEREAENHLRALISEPARQVLVAAGLL